ncbi:MAG: hemerythrin [Paludibacter sp. 47-17]|nr:MAG: hemerythrin [Paludibacter sp. 47-17]
MSELINNSIERKKKLKELILKLHHGESQEAVRNELLVSLSQIPYGEVVEVEQELISEGLPEQEVLDLCDAHSAVLEGRVDLSAAMNIPPGHPVDVMLNENKELKVLCSRIYDLISEIADDPKVDMAQKVLQLRAMYNNLYDVDKLYQRKEYLIFPYLEKEGITGPPKVMWGKHDEIRGLIKGAIEVLQVPEVSREELMAAADMVLLPAIRQVVEMGTKESEILFPMSMDKLTEAEWYEIARQSIEIGFCLYDPPTDWRPGWVTGTVLEELNKSGDHIQLPSGGFTAEELMAILNTLPVDMTFVDKDDKVKYFSQSSERIFQRNRAILNRDVRLCHPPASAHIVDKIIDDFKTGKASRAPFWITMKGKMIHIEYFALRNEKGEYLGTLEMSHDVTVYRELEGEQRILSYSK